MSWIKIIYRTTTYTIAIVAWERAVVNDSTGLDKKLSTKRITPTPFCERQRLTVTRHKGGGASAGPSGIAFLVEVP